MEPRRQREVLLAVLALALIGTAVWRMRSGASEPVAPATGPRAPVAAVDITRDKRSLTEVDLRSLESKRPEPEETGRNPFTFKPKPPPPAPPPVRPVNPLPMPTGPIEPPPPPLITLKFIGVADAGREGKVGRVAVLSDLRGVYYGREGEIIEGRYRIVKIGVESIDLEYLDGRGRQTIRLTGQ